MEKKNKKKKKKKEEKITTAKYPPVNLSNTWACLTFVGPYVSGRSVLFVSWRHVVLNSVSVKSGCYG